NNGFGEDDWDVLANEWDAEELQEWGMELPMDWVSPDEFGDEISLPDGEQTFKTMTFMLAPEQADAIESALKIVDDAESFGNTNSNGNKLYNIVSQWEGARK
ncbi:MAG: hypothetical protein IIZ44_11665, partial [Muribaculaceae bacterium]|nr:hypothetical protein [Muribaculaceae bacterium]